MDTRFSPCVGPPRTAAPSDEERAACGSSRDRGRVTLGAGGPEPNASVRADQASVLLDDLRDAQTRALSAALEATRIKSDFLANVSHELRTPLNAVLGFLDLALDTDLDADQRELLERARSAAHNMLALIINLLDCAKLESRALEVEATPFSLRHTLQDALAVAALRAHHNGVELCCDVRPDVPDALIGQPTRLGQVLTSLLDNATKFTDDGEIVLRVSVDTEPAHHDTRLHFAVSDTGIGIPRGKYGLIFEPFVQVDGSMHRKYAGAGLGLTIARHLVELMGGTIWLESVVGVGTTFHFTLRVGIVNAARPSGGTAALAQTTVLLADDRPTTRRLLAEMTRRWGMIPTLAQNVPETLAALASRTVDDPPFAVAIVDAEMRDHDGTSLVDALARLGGSRTPIVLLTSPQYPADLVQYLELNVAGYVSKPVMDSALHDVLAAVLSRPSRTRPRFGGRQRAPTRPLRILFAADDPVHREFIMRLLKRCGHRVLPARDGHETLSLLAAERVDLLLLDLQEPEVDSIGTARIVRAREAGRDVHLPIVALTTDVLVYDRERHLRAGMDAYVPKPVEPNVLFTAIEHVTSRRSGSRHVARRQEPRRR
jgi:signal transduction histidine kinase/CheY-like chemotaxis protein